MRAVARNPCEIRRHGQIHPTVTKELAGSDHRSVIAVLPSRERTNTGPPLGFRHVSAGYFETDGRSITHGSNRKATDMSEERFSQWKWLAGASCR
jgi:hypothetical protein